MSYDWLIIELVAVPEQYRKGGYGSKLMVRAEEIARNNGCAGIWLDTFELQARGFYEKLGFELFGEPPNHPRGQKRFFLRKILR
ncbi:GNAT family N-acetyltransferase [Methylobacterium sp. CM6257]